MIDRVDELIVRAGWPEKVAGFSTTFAGLVANEVTEPPHSRIKPLYEAIDVGAGVAGLAVMALVAEIRRIRRLRSTEDINGAGGYQDDSNQSD